LRDARKRTPRPEDYARRVRILHDHGIQVNGSFVLGFDHDHRGVFAATAEWIEANRLECATFHILTPYPATPLYRQMEAEGRLLIRRRLKDAAWGPLIELSRRRHLRFRRRLAGTPAREGSARGGMVVSPGV